MLNPEISYVIPCYNCEATIYSTVLSIKECEEELWPKTEVICVNDGSNDSTIDVLRSIEEEFKNVIVFSTQNKGKGCARNLGNEVASADIICVLDSDDINIANRSGTTLKVFNRNTNASVFYSSFITLHKYTGKQGKFLASPINVNNLKDTGNFHICHSTVAYRKQAIIDLPYSEDRNKDDWSMLWNFYSNKYKFCYSDKFLVCYFISEDTRNKENSFTGQERILEKKKLIMDPYFKNKAESNETKINICNPIV